MDRIGCTVCGRTPTYSGLCAAHVYDEQLPLGQPDPYEPYLSAFPVRKVSRRRLWTARAFAAALVLTFLLPIYPGWYVVASLATLVWLCSREASRA